MSGNILKAKNPFIDEKKRNEKLKLIINQHKTVPREFVHLFT
jgi:hypothetical protein